ncbi:hypothetical protein BTO20_00360 [Mycobacterium dioxanotrophicus]|uniref:Aminotransferase class I/classII large domain-containing protein n=1 Tax=Mycobacterium dioxanotrophicus TaxID=482462 RepID=A0A1Y0BWK8_9MYCO|nr:aromatic amino acid transaminase [Mycobacterium dioxanotrophicus]ART67278.1 hypothetical protein BTO20_00360 [Mycobacterium dioxanotrophicus]
MLELIESVAIDPLWAVANRLQRDTRPDVLDLVVGVYRDRSGATPVMGAVAEAERRLTENGLTKAYRGLSGNVEFNQLMTQWVLGDVDVASRAYAMQTIAGTGALRLLADFIASTTPSATVWLSSPSYVNHQPIMMRAGLRVRYYPYVNSDGCLDLDGMLAAFECAEAGDVVLIQGCCHNPTGVDLSDAAWVAVTDTILKKRLLPLVDIAYVGLGDGIDADLAGLRYMIARVPEALVAVSCSKNFGLYCERAGCCIVVGSSGAVARAASPILESIARVNYSMPPDHGSAVVAAILSDVNLREMWVTELDGMRSHIRENRVALGLAFGAEVSKALQSVAHHRGMFSLLPLSKSQMNSLAEHFGIYGTTSGRINVAGIRPIDVERIANAILRVDRLHVRAIQQQS